MKTTKIILFSILFSNIFLLANCDMTDNCERKKSAPKFDRYAK